MRAPIILLSLLAATALQAQEWKLPDPNEELTAYFRAETERIAKANDLTHFKTAEDWRTARAGLRRELFEMLGLDPLPERTPLNATVTGSLERNAILVEKLHFQSRPGLYVTANLYRPKAPIGKLPAILYSCGHGPSKKDGVSFGNKVSYHHHGLWFARHGYACLIVDTLQMGEIEGIHHGTYRYKRWWWNNRGYTPAGVEAWNAIRALDYLQSRPDIDAERIGATGRSGGGIGSWWIAALDERIKVAVPVAGITSLRNQVVDGCVEGHCDCMFMVNTHRWDFAKVAALVAPRPLLISNSDKDGIFPLDGVYDIHRQVRHIYRLLDKPAHLGLNITEGPHKDTQQLRVSAFHWFNRFLKGDGDRNTPLIDVPADKMLQPEQLKVFKQLPADEKNTTIDETFIPAAAEHAIAESKWPDIKKQWRDSLRTRTFGGWPTGPAPKIPGEQFRHQIEDTVWTGYHLATQAHVTVPLLGAKHEAKPKRAILHILDPSEAAFLADRAKWAAPPANEIHLYTVPRGTGPVAWQADERKLTQIRRRFMLLGQTLDGMRAHDIRVAIDHASALAGDAPLEVRADGQFAALALFATTFATHPAKQLTLADLSADDGAGAPILLNSRRHIPPAYAMLLAGEKSRLVFKGTVPPHAKSFLETAAALGQAPHAIDP